jgi:hypothetical protein
VTTLVGAVAAPAQEIHLVDSAAEAADWILTQLDIHRTETRSL